MKYSMSINLAVLKMRKRITLCKQAWGNPEFSQVAKKTHPLCHLDRVIQIICLSIL